ncbi:MAG TPA: RsmB/NOP family class I SAM-dependent RNA methyltransferase [Candidatus Omnitrophota bacterium]|nr:RsmB/NOP family class I SAM-dependent RNA methyltransferase [Candidatus Omnitrophota bacterium]
MSLFPEQFLQRLDAIIPAEDGKDVLASLSPKEQWSVRINLLKAAKSTVLDILRKNQIPFQEHPVFDEVLTVSAQERQRLLQSDLIKEGKVYFQNLSSIAAVKILDPKPGEAVLDLCAAPGSKTSLIAAMMNSQGRIVAIEPVPSRFYKLKSVLGILGVINVECKRFDGRRYRPKDLLFDKVLVDAPCSSEGRFDTNDPETFAYWSLRKIKEMQKKQKGLLLRGCQLLKPGGTLVYSTCTFAPEENEGVIDWVLRKMDGAVHPEHIQITGAPVYPALKEWKNKKYNSLVSACARIRPDRLWDAFFIAKLQRL